MSDIEKQAEIEIVSIKSREKSSVFKYAEKVRWGQISLLTKVIVILINMIILVWGIILILLVARRPAQPLISNGYQEIASTWTGPESINLDTLPSSRDLSQGITAKPIHSHNDYDRKVPLFDALAVGCLGVEADLWLVNGDLLVAHMQSALNKSKTLRSLYIDPLSRMLENGTAGQSPTDGFTGIYASSPATSLNLLIDMKTDGAAIWPVLLQQLEPLRQKGLLTTFTAGHLHSGPITIVGSGNTPFALVENMIPKTNNGTANDAQRFIFFDAPLANLTDAYTAENSLYASEAFGNLVGRTPLGGLSKHQRGMIAAKSKLAASKGLEARYWAAPSWPISIRDGVWRDLVDNGAGMLNADDVVAASSWNWDWCQVLGVRFC